MNKMTPWAELILAIAREVVSKEKNQDIPILIERGDVNWVKFKKNLSYHGLFPFAYLSLKDFSSCLPPDINRVLETTYYFTLKRTVYLEQQFLHLWRSCKNQDILMLPIKGMALMEDLYSGCPVRPCTDIDILVRETDVEKATALLLELGFEKELEGLKDAYWRQKQYHFVFTKRGSVGPSLIVELHWDLDYKRRNERLLPAIFNRLSEIQIQNEKIKLISPEDTLFTTALHQRRFGTTLCLKDVCDTALLLKRYQENFDWDYILAESRNSRLSTTVYFALFQTKFFFDLKIPNDVWNALKPPQWKEIRIQKFIEKNTFSGNWDTQDKTLYLKAHFLLYDSLWEPIDYILNIPQEQFAKFYNLGPYDPKTDFLYKNRLFYIPYMSIFNFKKDKWPS